MSLKYRLELMIAGVAAVAIFSYLCIPGHPLGTFFYNLAPVTFRQTVLYGQQNSAEFWTEVKNHISVTIVAVGVAFAICFPLGIIAAKFRLVRTVTSNVVGIARGLPGLAVLFLMWPYLGTGEKPTVVALSILAAPPIFLNTAAAYANVDQSIVEAARGMGMNKLQVLLRVESPLAARVVVAGLRTATVEVIASATIATYIDFDTLGRQITYYQDHLTTSRQALALGVGTVVALALMAEISLATLQRIVTPAHR